MKEGNSLVIDVHGLTKSFSGRRVVDGIDLSVMEGENEIRPAFARQCSMRPRLPLEPPTDAQTSSKNTACFR